MKTKTAPIPAAEPKPETTVLVLRSCRADGGSHNGFKYPLTEGVVVECPDWDPEPVCGGGLHGLLWGVGDVELLCWDADAWWQVFEVDAADVVEIDACKVKFRRGRQVFLRQGVAPGYPLARAYVIANRPKPGTSAPASTAGDRAPASTAGYLAPASTAGRASIAACLGQQSRAKAGPAGCVIVAWWEGDAETGRPRVTVGYVGEGIDEGVWYECDEKGALVKCKQQGSA